MKKSSIKMFHSFLILLIKCYFICILSLYSIFNMNAFLYKDRICAISLNQTWIFIQTTIDVGRHKSITRSCQVRNTTLKWRDTLEYLNSEVVSKNTQSPLIIWWYRTKFTWRTDWFFTSRSTTANQEGNEV